MPNISKNADDELEYGRGISIFSDTSILQICCLNLPYSAICETKSYSPTTRDSCKIASSDINSLPNTIYATQAGSTTEFPKMYSNLHHNALCFIPMNLTIADRIDISYDVNITNEVECCFADNDHANNEQHCGRKSLHKDTNLNLNSNACVPRSKITSNGFRSMIRVSFITCTTLTCIMFSVTISLLIIYFILRDQPMYYDPYYILQIELYVHSLI